MNVCQSGEVIWQRSGVIQSKHYRKLDELEKSESSMLRNNQQFEAAPGASLSTFDVEL